MLKKIFKNSILYTIASQIPMFANIILLPFYSDMVNRNDYYIYGTVLAYVGAMSIIGDLGMIPILQNIFFKEKGKYHKSLKIILGFLSLYKIPFGILVGVVIYFFFRDEVGNSIWQLLFFTVIPIVFFDMTKSVGMRYFQWKHQHQVVYRATVYTGIIAITVTFVTIKYFSWHYMGWFASAFAAGLFQFIYYGRKLFIQEKLIPTFKINWTFIGLKLKISLPILPHQYSSYLLNTSDRLVLDNNQSNGAVQKEDIGLYNVAYSFAGYLNNFNGQVNTVLSPIYFELFASKDKNTGHIIRNLTFIWLVFTVSISFLASIWSKEVFHFLYINNTDNVYMAYQYAVVLFMSFTYRPMYVASVDKLIFTEKTTSLLKITTASGIINLILNLIFIPIYGIHAAIFTTFISYMYMGFSGFFFSNVKKHIELNYYPLVVLSGIFGITILATFIVELDWIIKSGLTIVLLIILFTAYLFKGKEMIEVVNKIKST